MKIPRKLTGFELDVEADKVAGAEDTEAEEQPAQENVESKPVVQKLKKKTELEDSLLKAIEEHGE
jgi:hypothetical protein